MGSAAAPAAVRRALAPNSEASDHPKRLEQFAQPGEPRGRGSLHPRRARSPKPTSEFGSNSPRHSSHHARPSFPWDGQAHFHASPLLVSAKRIDYGSAVGKIQISLLLVANAALPGLTVRLWTLWSYYVDALGDAFCGTGRLIASRKIAVLQAPLAVVTLLTLFLFVLHYGRLAEWQGNSCCVS